MNFQIKPGGDALCLRCKSLFQLKIKEENERRWYCTNFYADNAPFQIPGTVTSCSEFRQKNSMDLHEMKEVAWYIKKDPGGNIGFIKPGDKNYPGAGRYREIDS